MVVKCRVFPPICQSEEADKPLCFLHHLSVSLLCSSLLSMAACLIISALNHLCETGQREKGFFSLCFLSSLTSALILISALVPHVYLLPFISTSFKPWVFAPFYSRFFLCLTVELYFQLKPWSLCRCPQPGAETGAYQQPRCICHSLWCPCYVKWSGWGPASCRSKVVSTPWKDHKEAVSMIALQQQLQQFQFFPTFLTNELMFHVYNKTGTNWRYLCIILKT